MMQDLAAQTAGWRRWNRLFALTGAGLGVALVGFILAMDVYGVLPSARQSPRPLMDLNQRYMYPQVVRSGRFDAAIVGTSTVRLLDPAKLDAATGFRFANLAMNAATPWEQTQIAGLFAREVAMPKAVVWGIDPTWCESDATSQAKRLTPRPFPPWLYDAPDWRDILKTASFTTLEIAVRMAGYHLGLNKERLRRDGFEVFTPPEHTYDLARARMHLYGAFGGTGPDLGPVVPPADVGAEALRALRFPALAWLDSQLADLPATTRRLVLLAPVHAAHQPRPGSRAAVIEAECRAQLQAIAHRRNAAVVDFRSFSEITLADDNFWDPLHYRLPIAARIEAVVGDVLATGGAGSGDPAARITPAREMPRR